MELILPAGVEVGPKLRCLVTTPDGTCGAEFFEWQRREYIRHVTACTARHEEHDRGLSLRQRLGVFGGDPVVEDVESWVRKHRTEIIEGRKKL